MNNAQEKGGEGNGNYPRNLGVLTVTEKEGAATVSVSEKTTIKKGKESVKLSELKPGDEVTVVYVKEGGKDGSLPSAVRG